ncbi:MAG: glycosyltransferase family 2 protein [Acidimicrobiales bacterium]
MGPEYSFVIPILDERDTLPELCRRLQPVMDGLDGRCEVVLVDDGSTDGSFAVMQELCHQDDRFRALRLSRNFGHQIAISAGLDHARGNAVIIMDGDLQDPPEVALAMAERWREGYAVVYAVRDERAGESRVKLLTATWFYRLMGRLSEVDIPPDAGDFRLVDRRAVDAVTSMPEHRRYLRGMFAWVGYDQTGVHYSRAERHAGRTKFPLRKMMAFATDGIVSFSTLPLRLTMSLGFVVSVLSFVSGVLAVILKLTGVFVVPGWASVVVSMAFLGGVQLTVLGVMGEYIARIHDEVKRRPLYLVRDQVGVDRVEKPPPWRAWDVVG